VLAGIAAPKTQFLPGLLTLTTAESFSYTWEFAVCGLVGLLGGVLGAGFNWLHKVRK
jgi:hypothetical protein